MSKESRGSRGSWLWSILGLSFNLIQVTLNLNKFNIEELLKLMTIQCLPNYGEMIYYITKYHIKYPLNIHNREESTSKKGQTEVT